MLRLWALYAWLDLTWVTQNGLFFVMYFSSDLVLNIAAVLATLLLAERFQGIGSWTSDGILFLLGYAMLARGIPDVFGGFNVSFISRRVGRGQLDHTLIQPQPLALALLTDGFMPFSGSATIFPGVALLAWATIRLGLTIHPGWLALLALNLAASAAITVAFSYVWASLAFWAPRGAEEISTRAFEMIDQLKPFPLDGVGSVFQLGLLSVVPAGFVAWYPTRALLGLDRAGYALWLTPLAAVVLAGIAFLLFRQGLKHYGYTGSQRYLSMGHRS